jgi:hypothetical protein
MDDEKSIAEKLTEAIGKAAASVKNVVSHVVDSASDAAQHAMEANAEKIARIPPAGTGPEQVAGTTNEQLYIPEASDAAVMPMPLFPAAPAPEKKRAPQTAAAAKAKKSLAKKTAGKAAKKTAKPSPARKPKSSAGKKSVGKNKAIKKTGKKPKR